MSDHEQRPGAGGDLTRRRALFGAAGAAGALAVGAGGWALGRTQQDPAAAPAPTVPPDTTTGLAPSDQRPGITHPAVPQRHLRLAVLSTGATAPATVLDRVQGALATTPELPADAGTASTTIGFGERLATDLWPHRATGDLTVPGFRHDTADLSSGGDLAVQVCAETAAGAEDLLSAVLAHLGDVSPVWRAGGYRDAPTPAGTTRTSSGFIDGIMNPRDAEALREGVWVGPQGRDTYVAYRRMVVLPSFAELSTAEQERAIGRRADTGAPLSGGGPMDEVDLFAKAPDGRLLTPTASHARRAHPANLGRALMLRRSYAFDPPEGFGLVFVAFMNDPQTFVLTQQRLDESDDFLAHSQADAVGLFFVPEL